MTTKQSGPLNQYFYFFMSLLIAVVVVYGFSHTIDQNLIHATPIRPWIVYLHGAVFSGWVIFFIVQSALVRTHNVRIHRKLGWFGVALGTAIPVLGISTAITMDRFQLVHFPSPEVVPFLAIQFCDMACFTIFFALAVYWRKKPEFHRRLMLIASCGLTAAAFARFPMPLMRDVWFYAGVDILIVVGVLRDLIVTRRVHPVYRYALPALIVTQTTVMYLYLAAPPRWVAVANAILR
jgi:hypothetical protein